MCWLAMQAPSNNRGPRSKVPRSPFRNTRASSIPARSMLPRIPRNSQHKKAVP